MSNVVLLPPEWSRFDPKQNPKITNKAPSAVVIETISNSTDAHEFVGLSDPPDAGDPLVALIAQWVEIALRHARTRRVGERVMADVVGLDGAWSEGSTDEEALAELPSVLTEWVQLKLEDGDDDIPPMEGVHLIVDR